MSNNINNKNNNINNNINIIRIIGGKHRGRKISILPNNNIRPTSDRVRETLFNWLMHDIQNARVLDLFTGSGAISIEALSRNAGFVLFNDINPKIIAHVTQILKTLNTSPENFQSFNTDAITFLSSNPTDIKQEPFDIIILDPPFNKSLVKPCLDLIIKNNWSNILNPEKKTLIYLEAEKDFDIKTLESHTLSPYNLCIKKQKVTGNVFYALLVSSKHTV